MATGDDEADLGGCRGANPEREDQAYWDAVAEWDRLEAAACGPVEADRDLMVKDGLPRGAAEHMALQHAREQALTEARADREAGT